MTEDSRTIVVDNMAFIPELLSVTPGMTVYFNFRESGHTVVSDDGLINLNDGTRRGGPISAPDTKKVIINGQVGAEINYHCGIHGQMMAGKLVIVKKEERDD